MTSSDALLEQYYTLRPADFGFLECLELRQSVRPEEWSGFTLTLRLRSSTAPEAKSLILTFTGVQDLRVGSLEGLVRFLVEIRSIREQQMEGLNYKVVEKEHNAFSFFCSSFFATLATDGEVSGCSH
jgi:hypothetical protein